MCKTLWMCVLLPARVFIWAPGCVARVACVILRHSCKKCCFASHFLPERLKIETFMLSECTFPSGSVQLWMSAIGRTPSRGHLLPRLPLAGTCGGSVRKSFSDRTQEPREAAGNWEKDNVGATSGSVGRVRETASSQLWVRLLGRDLPAQQRAEMRTRWSHGYRDRRGQWFTAMTLREHVS